MQWKTGSFSRLQNISSLKEYQVFSLVGCLQNGEICSGHGLCQDNKCNCTIGFTGEYCEHAVTESTPASVIIGAVIGAHPHPMIVFLSPYVLSDSSSGSVAGALVLFCLCCALITVALLLGLRYRETRRRFYDVVGAVPYVKFNEDGTEMGRRGRSTFTYREIAFDDLVFGRLLGQGSFGKVRNHSHSNNLLTPNKVYKGTWRGAPVGTSTYSYALGF